MADIINGLEIANKRMKEKEELTSEIFFWSAIYFTMLFKEVEDLLDIKFNPYDKRRALICAHIVAKKKAEMILKNKKVD
jgi:hypothetical protein